MAKHQKPTPFDASATNRKRLSPDARKDEIVLAAVGLFTEVGFDGSTRDLARRAGITQPLLYRYFPSKDSLIEAVYSKVYLGLWNPDWDEVLIDRTRPVKSRFQEFYDAYTGAIFNPTWLRISSFSALRKPEIHNWYNHVVQEMILKPLVRERRIELECSDSYLVSREELNAPWLMHGGLMDYGMRRYILEAEVSLDIPSVISQALDMYLLLSRHQPDAKQVFAQRH